MKRKACMIIALLCLVITVFNIAYTVKDEFFYRLDNLPTGRLLRTDINQHILFSTGVWLEVYEIEETSDHPSAIRVEVKNSTSKEGRTIYWQIGTGENLISWPEDMGTTVIINGVPVDYENGHYDCRDYRGFIYVPDESQNKGL